MNNRNSMPPAVPVVAYHDVDRKDVFRRQLQYVRHNYTVVGLDALQKSFDGSQQLPDRPLAITFDDAYPSVYHAAFPLLREAGLPAAIFVITELVGTDQPYWWEEIMYYLPDELDGRAKNAKVWEVKGWKNQDRLDFIEEIKRKSTKTKLIRKHLTWEQLEEMQESGISICNHTHDHPMLDQVSTAEARRTIREARIQLDQRGLTGRYFAYPNGNSSEAVETVLEEEGISLAFLFDHQLYRPGESRYRISRLSMNSRNSVAKTRLILNGYHSKYMNLRRSLGL